MQIIILLLILISVHGSFRYVNNQSIKLGDPFAQIKIASADFLVYQTNNSQIGVYSLSNDSISQIFKSQKPISSVSLSTSNKQIFFLSNDSIFQIQNKPQNKTDPTILYSPQSKAYLGALFDPSSSLIISDMFVDGSYSNLSFVVYQGDIPSNFILRSYNPGDVNITGGSQIITSPSSSRYFLSGARIVSNSNYEFYLYLALYSDMKFVVALPFKGSLPNIPNQKWGLTVSDIYNGDSQKFAITYEIQPQKSQRIFTVSSIRINILSQKIMSQSSTFQIKGLIGLNYLQTDLYSIDTNLCRLLVHNSSIYSSSQFLKQYTGKGSIMGSTISEDQNFIMTLTDISESYLYDSSPSNGYQMLKTTALFDYGLIAKKAYILKQIVKGLPSLLFLSSKGEIYMLKSGGSTLYGMKFDDMCINTEQAMFAVTNSNNSSILSIYLVDSGLSFQLNYSIPFVVGSLLCLADSSVLVNPLNSDEYITILKYDNSTDTVNILSKKLKITAVNFIAYRTTNGFYFTNQDNYSIPIFYDLQFNQIQINSELKLAPGKIYQIVGSTTDDLFLAVGSSIDRLDSLDYYYFDGNSLIYKGSFPLNQYGYAGLPNIAIFNKKRLVSISYTNPSYTIIYKFDSPPVRIQNQLFYKNTNSCNNFAQAIIQRNPETNAKQFIILGAQQNGSIIQKYSFDNNSIILIDQIQIKDYPPESLQIKLSENKRLLIISDLKKKNQSSTYNSLEMRSYNNLSKVIALKNYSSLSSNKIIHDHVLSPSSIFTLYASQDNYKELYISKEAISSSPTQIDDLITTKLGKIAQFTLCKQINSDLTRLIATLSVDLMTIAVLDMISGNLRGTVVSNCTIQKISLAQTVNPAQPWLLSYRCLDQNLFVVSSNGSIYFQGAYDLSIPFQLVCNSKSSCYILINQNGFITSVPVAFTSNNQHISERSVQYKSLMLSNQIVYDSYLQIYANKVSSKTVSFTNLNNQIINSFTINNQNQTIEQIFWQQQGKFALLTSSSNLIFLSQIPCYQYSNPVNGYCKCDASFIQFQDHCQCPQSQIVKDNKCLCVEGKYNAEFQKCEDCSWICSTCSQDGFFSCDSFQASFIGLCCAIGVLILIGVFLIIRKLKKKRQQKTIVSTQRLFISEKDVKNNTIQ